MNDGGADPPAPYRVLAPVASMTSGDVRDDGIWFPPEEGIVPSEVVVEAVAEVKGNDPTALPALYDVVDPDALNTLFRNGGSGFVDFAYAGCVVSVRADGQVVVRSEEERGL